jgi:hypothetical protein
LVGANIRREGLNEQYILPADIGECSTVHGESALTKAFVSHIPSDGSSFRFFEILHPFRDALRASEHRPLELSRSSRFGMMKNP